MAGCAGADEAAELDEEAAGADELLAADEAADDEALVVEDSLERRLPLSLLEALLPLSFRLEPEEADVELLLVSSPLSSSMSSAAYSRAHLESLMTSCRLPLTRTASTVSGIDQLLAWF